MNFEGSDSLIIIDLQKISVIKVNKKIIKITIICKQCSKNYFNSSKLDHLSFASNQNNKIPYNYEVQVLWPNHCVQGTFGAEFHKSLI